MYWKTCGLLQQCFQVAVLEVYATVFLELHFNLKNFCLFYPMHCKIMMNKH